MPDSKDKLAFLVKVDDICDEYQSRFAEGQVPRLEDFLKRVEPEHCSSLLRELLLLEAVLRTGKGEQVSAGEMVNRYSAFLPAAHDRAILKSDIEKAISETDERHALASSAVQRGTRQREKGERLPRIPGFEIERVLGRGGMGIVYQAQQRSLNRTVALKMILRDVAEEEDLERFKKEAQAVAELNDPHFVQIFEFGEFEGQPYMALEFVDGGSLEEDRSGEPQPVAFAAETIETLARAMHKAHVIGLVHRDLKPHNVLLAGDGTLKITDFGLVKRQDQDETQMTKQGTVMGTASYMSPEQSHGAADVGPGTDVHALGGVLYCLLTGRPPFLAATVYDTILQVRGEDPVPPSRLRPDIPKDLETICLKCLEKEPQNRYAAAAELADDTRRYLEGRPIVARPASAVERGWRWAKRNPWVAGLGSTVATLLITVAVVSSVLTVQAETARVSAEETGERLVKLVQGLFFQVDTKLRNDPDQFQLRKQILELGGGELDAISQHMEEHPLRERIGVVVYQRLGDCYRSIGKLERARLLFAKNYELLQQLARKYPKDPTHRFNLAICVNKLGEVYRRLGDTPKARDYYRHGLRYRQQQAELIPSGQVDELFICRQGIADSYYLLGRIDNELGEPLSAVANFELAIGEWNNTSDDFRSRVHSRRVLGNLDQVLGETHYQLDNPDEAERLLNKALEQREYVAERRPLEHILHDLCRTRLALGDHYLFGRKDNGKAWAQYRLVLKEYQKMWEMKPRDARTRTDLSSVNYRLGATLQRAEASGDKLDGAEAGDAQKFLEKSAELRGELAEIDSTDMQSKIEWALALARLGRVDEAEEVAEALTQAGAGNPRLLAQAGYTFALCSVTDDTAAADRYREKAFETLRACIDAGWRDWVAFRDDPDLDPLRDDPGFKDLLDSVKKEATAAAAS